MTTTTGRPRTFDPDQVLEGALELFWRHGYRKTTLRRLAVQLGLSQSSLYNAFGSKRLLLEAALDRYERMSEDELLGPLAAAPSGLDGIAAFFEALARWVTTNGKQGCMIINLMAEGDGAGAARAQAYRARVWRALRDALARAGGDGETSAEDVDVRADLLFATVLGLNVVARGGAGSEVPRLLAGVQHLISSWRN